MKRAVALACLVCAVVALLAGCRKKEELSAQEAALYAGKIKFSRFRMSAAENMAGIAVYNIEASVTNGGDRPVRWLEVQAIFRDPDGLVVFKETAPVVTERRGILEPHQSRDFRMGFEGIPESWNRSAPELQITKLLLD